MNKDEILVKVNQFYKDEIKGVKRALECKHFTKKEIIKNSLQRGLGVAFFVQELDIPFEDIDKEYEWFRTQVEGM